MILNAFVTEVGKTEKYILRLTQAYFLASMTAIATIDFGLDHNVKAPFLIATGIVVLFLYLLSKIEQRKKMMQFSMQFNRNEIKFSKSNLKYDVFIAVLTVAFYVVAIFYKPMVKNVANDWVYNAINNIYETPIIGWIIGLIGVFFIFSIFIKGLVALQLISGQMNNLFTGNKSDDDFVDYEEVEEDQEHKYIDHNE